MDKKVNPKIVVKEYLKNIPRNIKVKGVFLFGGYATGKVSNDSDIDIIVISPNFKNISFIKRLEMLSHTQGAAKITRSVPMDIFGYTPEEFKNIDKESIVMRRAKKEGKMIYVDKTNELD
ncbi:MAG: nucleotidyltransferase domain-containing protein [Candidatus Omnitrophica bacterium]|nr:nucleotidyltransferase domain-containing protein [Candidatus Omnitrophota bacterium]